MATTNQNVTADALISAMVKYSNKDDSARVYDISANVSIQDKKVNSFDGGEVRKIQSDAQYNDGMAIATFSSYGPKTLYLSINDADENEAKAIMEAVYTFIADVKANVNTNPVTA